MVKTQITVGITKFLEETLQLDKDYTANELKAEKLLPCQSSNTAASNAWIVLGCGAITSNFDLSIASALCTIWGPQC